MADPVPGHALAKMYLTNMSTGEEVYAQFNPTELTRSLEVNYARHSVVGLSHQPLQYTGTGNGGFSLELYMTAQTVEQAITNLDKRNFIESLCYPQVSGSFTAPPPRVLFVWPQFVSMTTVLTGMDEAYTRFSAEGMPTGMTITVKLEETRLVRLLSAQVRGNIQTPISERVRGAAGLRRSGTKPVDAYESLE